MAKKTPPPGSTTTLVYRIDPDLLRAFDRLRWFISLDLEPSELEDRLKVRDSRATRNAVASQALEWFAKPANHRNATYTKLRPGWVLISLTVARKVYDPIAAIAARDGRQTSRVIDAAIRHYCDFMVPEEMVKYHRSVTQHGSALLRAREKIRDK